MSVLRRGSCVREVRRAFIISRFMRGENVSMLNLHVPFLVVGFLEHDDRAIIGKPSSFQKLGIRDAPPHRQPSANAQPPAR
jgi:hypothetical protein